MGTNISSQGNIPHSRYAQSATFAKGEGRLLLSCRMSATEGRSSAVKGKKKRPSDDGHGTRVFAYGEDTHALRLASELADLRTGYANPSFARMGKTLGTGRSSATIKNRPSDDGLLFYVKRLRKRYFLRVALRIRTQGE